MPRRGKPNATLRIDPDLWVAFGALTDDRSAVLREFVRWFTRQTGAKLPQRP